MKERSKTFHILYIRNITNFKYRSRLLASAVSYRLIAVTSQILRVSSRCSLTISVLVQQARTAQKLTILIQNYYKVLQNLLCLQKLYYA
jgi:thiazole synthase ThiGH ThiG subunit